MNESQDEFKFNDNALTIYLLRSIRTLRSAAISTRSIVITEERYKQPVSDRFPSSFEYIRFPINPGRTCARLPKQMVDMI